LRGGGRRSGCACRCCCQVRSDCNAWSPEGAGFRVPAGISFRRQSAVCFPSIADGSFPQALVARSVIRCTPAGSCRRRKTAVTSSTRFIFSFRAALSGFPPVLHSVPEATGCPGSAAGSCALSSPH